MTTVARSTSEVNGWLLSREKLGGITPIDHLWNRLSGTYGGRWLKDFPSEKSIENWKGAWAEALYEDRVTPHEVAEGLRACRRMFPDWPPAVGEFIQACRPGLMPENAFHDAVKAMSARRRGEVGEWTHPAVYWAVVDVGCHDLLNCGYSVMKTRWERALAEQLAQSEWPPIPAVVPPLPAPGGTLATREDAAKAMAKLGAQGIVNPAGRDPRRWARRILDKAQDTGRLPPPAVLRMAEAAIGAPVDTGVEA